MPKEEQTPPVQVAIEYLERFHHVKGQLFFNLERSLPDDIKNVLPHLENALRRYKDQGKINALTGVVAFIFHTARDEKGNSFPNALSLRLESPDIDYTDPNNLPKELTPITLDPNKESHQQFNKRLDKVNVELQKEIQQLQERRDAIYRVSC